MGANALMNAPLNISIIPSKKKNGIVRLQIGKAGADLYPHTILSLVKALADSQSLSLSLRHRRASVVFGAWYCSDVQEPAPSPQPRLTHERQ